jgi:hypothetical protein
MTALERTASLGVSFIIAVVVALSAAACGGSDSTTSTTPTAATGPSTELFEGQLSAGGSAFYSFTVATTGLANVMLASVTTTTAPGTSSAVVLGLALGTPAGTDCQITNSLPTAAGLTSQMVNSLTPGVYCARVYDLGNLRATVNFAIRILHT